MVAAHKKFPMPEDSDLYMPVLVGASRNYIHGIDYQRDDDGENISEKNPNYNELTAVYWAWKNLKGVDAVGLVHYRRYFFHPLKKGILNNVMSESNAENLLKDYDVILPRKRNYVIETNYSHYIHAHNKEPLDKLRTVVKKLYPEYLQSFDLVMARRKAHMFNMFVMKQSFFEDYAEWLMKILITLESEIDISDYSVQESRVFGYIGELLMDVWINFNDINYVEVPWKQIGKTHNLAKMVNFLKRKFLPKLKSKTHF